MNIKIHSSELNRMMKTVGQCIDPKNQKLGNIHVIYDNNLFSIRGSNGATATVMSTPVIGGDGEMFCVDGTMFAKVCAMCNGEIDITTDGKVCTIKGVGRTRLPIVNVDIPSYERVNGNTVTVSGGNLSNCYKSVAYAIAEDQSRIQLTGVLMESEGESLRMVAIDGFQMSIEETVCEGDKFSAIIPGAFMKLLAASVSGGESVKLTVDGHAVQAETDGMLLKCPLLAGEFIDYNRIMPKEFKIATKVNAEAVRTALKAGNVVNNKQNLVKLDISDDVMKIMNNSEQADFEADVPCQTVGGGLKIAFNEKYLMNMVNSIDTEDADIHFNSSVSPVVIKRKDTNSIRLVLPVRVM